MIKNIIILAFAVVMLAGPAAAKKKESNIPDTDLLGEGSFQCGIDGELISDVNGTWFFVLDHDITDDFSILPSGTKVELLRCSALEKLLNDANDRPNPTYKIWASVVRYHEKNCFFLNYFLPLTIDEKQTSPEEQTDTETYKIENEPQDTVQLPEEIIKKIKTRKVLKTEQLKPGLELKEDSMLADRTGFIVENDDGTFDFVLDAIGWNIQKVSFPLLNSIILQKAVAKQYLESDPIRFKVTGILTNFKGTNYMLLQKATRIYSYQNFN